MKNQKTILYSIAGAGVGVLVAYILVSRNKNLDMVKTLTIGGVSGLGLGLISGLIASGASTTNDEIKETQIKQLTEGQIREFAKSLGIDSELQVNSYILILNQVSHTPEQKQNVLKVLDAMLKAKRDKKWDEKGTLTQKKEILMSYGITDKQFNVFQEVTTQNLTNLIADALTKRTSEPQQEDE